MTDRSGILPNSPLIFAVASVRFTTLPLLSARIEEIHEALREHFPHLHKVELQMTGPHGQVSPQTEHQSSTAWVLLSSDRSMGFQIRPDQLLFFSKKYSRYDAFANYVNIGLTVLFEKMRFLDVLNIGIRYIDHIKPKFGETISQYIHSSFLPTEFSFLRSSGGFSDWDYELESGGIFKVKGNGRQGSTALPDDLMVLQIISGDMTKPLVVRVLEKEEYVIDMDAIQRYPEPSRLSQIEISDRLLHLHSEANRFFRSDEVFKPFAFETWGGAKNA